MNKPTVLFLFNSSRYAVEPWLDGMFNCVSVDHSDTDHSGEHRLFEAPQHWHVDVDLSQRDAFQNVNSALDALGLARPSFVLSFAPCTDLAVSGAAHFAKKLARDPDCQNRAVRQAVLASGWGCPYIVENPVSVLASLWRKPTGYVHPWEFSFLAGGEHPEFPDVIPASDMYNKKTGLWCGNGAEMPERVNDVPPSTRDFPGHTKLGGKSARTKYIRSLTPRGLAWAIYFANSSHALENVNYVTENDLLNVRFATKLVQNLRMEHSNA